MIKVSIIVPVYNVELSLEKCINSLLKQTLDDIEIILVNDGSPDNCPKICEEYAKKYSNIKVINKENSGLGYARNSGLSIAQGEFVGFVDSDDYVDCNMFEQLYNAAVEVKADSAYTGYYNVYNNRIISVNSFTDEKLIFDGKNQVQKFLMDLIASEIDYPEDSKYGATVWKGIFKRDIIEKHDLKFYSEKEYISEDGLFNIDFFTKVNKVVIIPGCYYYYLYNPNSLTAVYKEKRFEKNKELYKLGKEKLYDAYNDKNILKQYSRMFIAASRVCIIQEVNNIKKFGFVKTYRNIKNICKDEVLVDILNNYPWKKFTLKKRIFTIFIKYRMVLLQIAFVMLNKILIRRKSSW